MNKREESSQDGLPELPAPQVSFTIGGYVEPRVTTGRFAFTADQMLAYGAQCRAAGQWIACSERLPVEDGPYLALNLMRLFQIAEWSNDHDAWIIWHNEDQEWITLRTTYTHWQPLPAPPIAAAKKEET